MSERATRYCSSRGMQPRLRLGFGKDATVLSTSAGTAIKIFDRRDAFGRELACYLRLTDCGIHEFLGLHVPGLINSDVDLMVIEMTVVSRPFLLDFASAHLDEAPDFPAEVIEQWEHDKQEEFGQNWPRVVTLLAALKEQVGIHLLDIHPGNILFD